MADSRAWMVRAGNDNELIDQFTSHDWVAIGWREMGDLSDLDTREDIKERYAEAYENASKSKRAVNSGQLHRFTNVIDEGDLVVTYDKSTREYHVGRVTGEYEYQPTGADDYYPNVRPVRWEETIDRDDLSTPAKNTLGGTLTVFSLDDIISELNEHLSGERPEKPEEPEEEEEDAPPFHIDVESKSDELISDHVAHIDPEEFEDLVAAVLRAMGYEATTTSSGADHGIDIIAHPDALGFDDPLIKVQVKQRSSRTRSGSLRDFIGTLSSSEKGLFVSTGGYTSDAEEEAARTDRRVTLLDRDDFIDLLIEHYEEIETEYRNLIPLKSVYVPTEEV